MKDMYIVYTEIFENGLERWFYGAYTDRTEANEVALELNRQWNDNSHCVCHYSEIEDFGIMNLPNWL